MPTLRFPSFTEEWQKHSLDKLGTTIIGLTYSPSDVVKENGTIVFRSSNIQNGEIDYSDIVRVGKEIKPVLRTKESDILICARNGSSRLIGKNAILKKSDEGQTFGAFMMIYRSKYNKFIRQLLNTKRYSMQVAQNIGARINQITTSDLNNFIFNFPTNPHEQKKIADFLSLLDERIALQSKLIDRLKSLMDGIRHRLFEESTVHQSLGNIVEIRKGKQINGSELLDYGEYPVMNGGITPSGFLNEYNIPAGTISISEGGNSCGYVQFNATPIWSGGHCYTLHLICGDIDYRYLYHFLKHSESEIMKLRIGSGLPNIQKKDLSKFPITSYPISNQMKISKTLDMMEARILNEEFMLQSYAKLKAYLLSAMFI